MKINQVTDPEAVLAIPTEADVEIIEAILEESFEDIENDYMLADADDDAELLTEGSLLQELQAQLRNQK